MTITKLIHFLTGLIGEILGFLFLVKTDTDAGVGKSIILNGTGPYKKLANKECIYAVSYLKDHAFVTTKCKVSNNIFNSLKN